MKNLLFKKHYFGEVAAFVHVSEFQKRGLPHEHFFFYITRNGFKITSPNQYDKIISAEIPNKKRYPELHAMVFKHMMHGPCGEHGQKKATMLRAKRAMVLLLWLLPCYEQSVCCLHTTAFRSVL